MLNLIALKEMKHQYGEKELFQMMVRRARGTQDVLDNVGAEEAREFITSPQPEIFSVDETATSETLAELAFGIAEAARSFRTRRGAGPARSTAGRSSTRALPRRRSGGSPPSRARTQS